MEVVVRDVLNPCCRCLRQDLHVCTAAALVLV